MGLWNLSLGNLEIHLDLNDKKFKKKLRNVDHNLKNISKNAKMVGKALTKYVTVPVTAVAAASVKAFADFDSAMTQSVAIMGQKGEQMRKQMEDVAKEISTNSIKSATELAESYFFLASAGFTVEQSMAALPVVTNFATAGMFDMAQATDLLTDAQSALGLTVDDSVKNMENMKRVSDVLVKANTLANATVEQFSTALTSKAGTAMKSYNIELEEGVAVLAAYADQGIKAELAGNMFDRMLRLLIKSINENKQQWDAWGIATTDAQGNLLPLADIIEGLTNHTKNMGAAQKAAALDMLGFQARSQQAILPLLGLQNEIRNYNHELDGASGTTDEIANKQLKSFNAQMKILWNNIKVAGIGIGSILEPWIRKLADALKGAVTWFRTLNEGTRKFIVYTGLFLAAIGPTLLAFGTFVNLIRFAIRGLGPLIWMWNTFIKLLGVFTKVAKVAFKVLIWGLKSMVKLLWAGIKALLPYLPFIAVFTAIALSVWMIVDAFTAADLGIQNWFRSMTVAGTSVGAWWDALGTYMWQVWDYVVNKLALGWKTYWFAARESGRLVLRFFLRVGKGISDFFWAVVQKLAQGFTAMIRDVTDGLVSVSLLTRKKRGEIIAGAMKLEQKVRKMRKNSNQNYNAALKKSLGNSKKDWEGYYNKVAELDQKHTENTKKWQETRNRIFMQDDRKQAGPQKPEGGGFDIAGLLGGFDYQKMLDEIKDKYKDTTASVSNDTQMLAEKFQTLAPSMTEFIQGTLGQIFEMATDPDVQAMGQANQQMFSIFEARLEMVKTYGDRHKEILEQIATSSLSVQEKQAAKEMAIEDHKRAVMLSGVASLLSAGLSLLASGGKKQFKLYKALAIAEAGIATYSAYNKALAAPPGPPATIPLAASILVMGLAKVRQIAMMQPGTGIGGGGGGGGATTNFGARPPAGGLLGQDEEERMDKPDKYTIIIENIHGSADEEFADMLAEKIADRSGDGREFGFETTTR